jgi:putative nucleotidyltransferase with HDIG domain
MGANPNTQASDTTGTGAANAETGTMKVDRFIASLLEDLKNNKLELPTLPQVAANIGRVLDNPRSRSKDVAQVVSTDMALSARLIHVANSPLVRSTRRIENVHYAIIRMGSTMVRNVITSFLIRQLFRSKQRALQMRMTAIWNHSAYVAAISHVLASRFTNFQTDEVMLAGLLHDIGKLPILAKAAKLPAMKNNENALDMVLSKLHPALGRAILETWKFPADIVNAAAEHENIDRCSKALDYTDVVIVANLHSYIGKSPAMNVDWNNIPAMEKLNLDPEMSIGVLEEAREEIQEIQKVLMN